MPITLSDNRAAVAMTVADADQIMRQIADEEISLAALRARAERKIADVKLALETASAPAERRIRELAAKLSRYIDAHQELFQRPRARKTDWGNYGIRTVSGLKIEDAEALIDYAVQNALPGIIETRVRLSRTGVEKALAEGVELPGAAIVRGERSFYKIEKALLDRAKKAE